MHSPDSCLESTLFWLWQTVNRLTQDFMRSPVFNLTVLAAEFYKTTAGTAFNVSFPCKAISTIVGRVIIIRGISKHETIQGPLETKGTPRE